MRLHLENGIDHVDGSLKTLIIIPRYHRPLRSGVDQNILVNIKQLFPEGEIRVFAQTILYPGKVHIAQKIKVVPVCGDLFQYPGMAIVECHFAPYLHHVHIGVDEIKTILRFGKQFVFQHELSRRNFQQVVITVFVFFSKEVFSCKFGAPDGFIVAGKLFTERAFAR